MTPEQQRDFEARRREIQIMADEYEEASKAYCEWFKAWKARQPKGFRAVRRAAQ